MARIAGWNTLLFLDDDITSLTGIDRVTRLTKTEGVAGFSVSRFPDNSVVRHAERLCGKEPGVKWSGGALMVDVAAITSFFPRIYNEDWFFVLGTGQRAFHLTSSGVAEQKAYDPFNNPPRAGSEEFGDLLAEGAFQLASEF